MGQAKLVFVFSYLKVKRPYQPKGDNEDLIPPYSHGPDLLQPLGKGEFGRSFLATNEQEIDTVLTHYCSIRRVEMQEFGH